MAETTMTLGTFMSFSGSGRYDAWPCALRRRKSPKGLCSSRYPRGWKGRLHPQWDRHHLDMTPVKNFPYNSPMTPPAPATRPPDPPLAGRIDLDDFDAMLAVSPSWSERHSQVSKGRARIRLALATTGRMQLAYAAKSPGCRIDGAPVPGTSLLGIPLAGPFLQLQGQLWRSDRFGYVPSGAEYAVLGSAPHRMLALAVQSDLLDRATRSRWGHGLPTDRSGPVLRERRPGGSWEVARTWIRWVATAVRHPEVLQDPAVSAQMEEEVLGAILDASEMVDGPAPARPWRDLALRAEAHLRDTLAEAPQLPDICRAVRASPRSLHSSFKATFNTTPKAYQNRPPARRRAARPSPCARGDHRHIGRDEVGLLPARPVRG